MAIMNRVHFVLLAAATLPAQEAGAGFELRTTLTAQGMQSPQLGEPPRSASTVDGGLRALLYPTLKLNRNWSFSGALQVASRPLFPEQFAFPGRGVQGDVLRGHVTYAKFASRSSIVLRAGIMPSAFGSFLLRYDDAVNPLLNYPQSYGYYYACISTQGFAAVQADVIAGRFDFRAQFTNSSPANRRGIFSSGQFGGWTGGAGYTIKQGFRVGASGYHGPYLHRGHRSDFGEARPRDITGSAMAAEVEWGGGPWNVRAEEHWFVRHFRAVPRFTQHSGYAEVRRVLSPRWYAATRIGYLRSSKRHNSELYEMALGFRLNTFQLIKAGYAIARGTGIHGAVPSVFTIQLVTTLRPVSIARD